MVLAACSTLFRNILTNNRQNKNPIIYLKGVDARSLTSVLDFMYQGQVNVSQEDLAVFLRVAEELNVKGLTERNTDEGQVKRTSAAKRGQKDVQTSAKRIKTEEVEGQGQEMVEGQDLIEDQHFEEVEGQGQVEQADFVQGDFGPDEEEFGQENNVAEEATTTKGELIMIL